MCKCGHVVNECHPSVSDQTDEAHSLLSVVFTSLRKKKTPSTKKFKTEPSLWIFFWEGSGLSPHREYYIPLEIILQNPSHLNRHDMKEGGGRCLSIAAIVSRMISSSTVRENISLFPSSKGCRCRQCNVLLRSVFEHCLLWKESLDITAFPRWITASKWSSVWSLTIYDNLSSILSFLHFIN